VQYEFIRTIVDLSPKFDPNDMSKSICCYACLAW
jgi:hypothetical protein